jgi:hypothetical protein
MKKQLTVKKGIDTFNTITLMDADGYVLINSLFLKELGVYYLTFEKI